VIVVDTSALTAIYRREDDKDVLQRAIASADQIVVPVSVYVEMSCLRRLGNPRRWLDRVMLRYGMAFGTIDAAVARIAGEAAERYGRGTGHAAGLNFGDCLSYAVAKQFDAPLLYKGDDFNHTDIESALAS
jgi:ribonuclease VapC